MYTYLFLVTTLVYCCPTILTSLSGAPLFKPSVNTTATQIEPQCEEQVKDAVARGTRFFSQLSATNGILIHIFPATPLVTVGLLAFNRRDLPRSRAGPPPICPELP